MRRSEPGSVSIPRGQETESDTSLELLRTQPEVARLLSRLQSSLNSRENTQEQKLDKLLHLVNAVAHGQFEISLPGPLTARLSNPELPIREPVAAPTALITPPASAPENKAQGGFRASSGPPAYSLFNARTVADIWREWKEGIAGGPSVKELEETWGHLWRPEQKARIAWSRRKVVLVELERLVARGRTEARSSCGRA